MPPVSADGHTPTLAGFFFFFFFFLGGKDIHYTSAPWRAVVTAAPTAPTWQQGLSAAGSQLIQNTQTGQHHSLNSQDQLQESHAQVVTTTSHVRVISWDPSRPWRGSTRQPTQSAAALYSQWQLWGPNHLSMGVFFFFFFFGLQDSCPFLSSKRAFRTPDEPEVRRNNGQMRMQ